MKTKNLFLFVAAILIASLLTACVNNPKGGIESDDINNFEQGKQMGKNMRNGERGGNFGSGMRGALSGEMMINTGNVREFPGGPINETGMMSGSDIPTQDMRKIPSFQGEETE